MDMRNWLAKQRAVFDLHIDEKNTTPSRFIEKTWIISDPHGDGLTFEISANDHGEASIFSPIELFQFEWLNIAEGYSSTILLDMATQLLRGGLEVRRSKILNRPSLIFRDGDKNILATSKVSLADFIIHRSRIENRLERALRGFRRR